MSAREHAETVRRYLTDAYATNSDSLIALDALLAEVERLEGERDEARAAFTEYGWHRMPCPAMFVDDERPCSCGYDAVLADGGQENPAS